MKIVIATPLYPPEIAEPAPYVKELAERLSGEHEIIIVAYASTSEKIKDTKLITIDKRRPLFIRLIKYLIEIFKASRNADVIYIQNSLAVGLPAIIAGFLQKVPVAIRFTEDEAWKRAVYARLTKKKLNEFLDEPDIGNLKIRLIMRAQGFILRQAQTVIVPSEYLRDALIKAYHLQNKKIIVNCNPAKKEVILPFSAVKIPRQIVAITDKKNKINKIINAVSLLKKEFPDIQLIAAEQESTRAEMWHLYKTSQVCILNSTEEFSETAIDCFNAGIPVVFTGAPDASEKNIADAILKLLKDHDLRERLVKDGQKTIAEKFSWDVHSHALLKTFFRISLAIKSQL
ncbi:MAG: glycosyltransferase family 4 protein [Candidatus Terrybacteria bacterium]|nr:glycosyltransferase family 4 protein [Candidatus Terrybacteria bacterium]